MQRYKIILAYDGTDYAGWQVQKDMPSVAQVLQDTFKVVFKKQIHLLGASRTDAGVHAQGQVAAFRCDMAIDSRTMLQAWNNLLPPSIVIHSLHEMAGDYNPHKNVVSKAYWYHFFLERPSPFVQRYGWFYRYPVNLEKLKKCLSVFVGTHDFRSFCTGDDRGDDTIRRIDKASLEYSGQFNAYRIAITGPRFLRYMVRRVVGACIEVASRDHLSIEHIRIILEKKNPEHVLPNAPAKGLMLHNIIYDGEDGENQT